MGNIVVLDELTVNKIAAGEVVERPASVIKEMVENSIDAGANQITVEIRRGGITYIRVTDNGSGIAYDDVLLAFEKHATSKISCGEDLDEIRTLGFRGEALSSISAVSKVDLTTKVRSEKHGVKVSIHGGNLIENTECACPDGTTFIVKDLFYNTPARYKFLKKDATEASHVIDLIERMSLAHPEIAFRLINNNSEIIRTRGDSTLKNVIYNIYGREVAQGVKEISLTDKNVKITGFAGGINSATASRNRQSLYINGRYVKSRIVYSAIEEAYKTLMMKGKHPLVVLSIELSPKAVDVNVHPTKMEVRFSDDGAIFRWVNTAVKSALFERKVDFTEPRADVRQGMAENMYSKPFDVKTKAEVKEDRAEYEKMEQTLPEKPEKPKSVEPEINPVIKPEHISEPIDEPVLDNKPEIEEGETKTEPNIKPNTKPEYVQTFSKEKEILENARFVGQAFGTYLILQYKEELILLDQHAAHERVLYEKIKKQYEEADLSIQTLLTPVVLELTKSEYNIFQNNREYFGNLGILIEEFGQESLLVREIPVFLDISDVNSVIADIINDIKTEMGTDKKISISNDAISLMACKAAIKANHKMEEREVSALLEGMSKLENPFTCPHGRPITVVMTKGELERKFKRVL